MNGLGKCCHDFPRLAKESGYTFQLYRGKINWSDLDNLNIQEIIDERKFQLLEHNLIHVINCNLEREYDLKILDQNFVKLFKLAQLGIDYLSYCELYLDRCVILLQEQLALCQEECAQLKEEIERKSEELKKSRKKAKLQSANYKCNKCSKIFLNEIYLESHEKRRHNRNAPETNQSSRLSYIDHAQQTDAEKLSISVFTQTLDSITILPDNTVPATGETENLKENEQEMKIDILKRDLEDLKIRLSLAEKTMEEKKNDERKYSNGFPSAVIPIIHSYISPTYNGQVPVIPGTSTILPGLPSHLPVREEVPVETVHKSNKPNCNECSVNRENMLSQASVEEASTRKSSSPERAPAEGASTVGSGSVHSNDLIANIYDDLKGEKTQTPPHSLLASLENQTMDVTPKNDNKSSVNAELKTNLPHKPKPKSFLEVENLTNDLPEVPLSTSPVCLLGDLKIESESPSESLEPVTSTPLRVTSRETIGENEKKWDEEMKVGKRERRRKSQETPLHDLNSYDDEGKSKSLFRKIVKKKSPKIQELTENFRNSFSHFYGSVSSVRKKNSDAQEPTAMGKSKSVIIEGLHKRLRELGVDPEWSGIPKETMKQKLNILEHHRNFLGKESRLYPYLRRKIQKHVLKKLKSNSMNSREKAQFPVQFPESDIPESSGTTSTQNTLFKEMNEIIICDTDGDSDYEVYVTKDGKSALPLPSFASDPSNKAQTASLDLTDSAKLSLISPGGTKWREEEQETTDFSIFQAGKFKSANVKGPELESSKGETGKPKVASIVDQQQTDSDFDDELFTEMEQECFQNAAGKSPGKDTIASFPAKPEENLWGETSRNAKNENQSILKSEWDNKPQVMSKKKVLFAQEPEIFESTSEGTKLSIEKQKIFDLSPIADDDDDWSIESQWIVNKTP